MKLYHYHEISGAFLWVDEARLDPLESEAKGAPVYVIPAFSTQAVPPSKIPENCYAFFDFEADKPEWKIAEIPAAEPEAEPQPLEPVAPEIPTISKRQFWQHIALLDWVTKSDALNFMSSGVLPPTFETAIETLDEDEQFSARMALMANEYERNSAFVPMLAALLEKSDEEIDLTFLGAATR